MAETLKLRTTSGGTVEVSLEQIWSRIDDDEIESEYQIRGLDRVYAEDLGDDEIAEEAAKRGLFEATELIRSAEDINDAAVYWRRGRPADRAEALHLLARAMPDPFWDLPTALELADPTP